MLTTNEHKKQHLLRGFTIIELLVVMVVIGILAAISVVSYNGVQKEAKQASLKSDISNARKKLEMFNVENGLYPATNRCSELENLDNICLNASSGNEITYQPGSDRLSYDIGARRINENFSIPILSLQGKCPVGFILVPASKTFNTNDFCIMKYEAKNDGSNNPISKPGGLPWVSLSLKTIITNGYPQGTTIDGSTCAQDCSLPTNNQWLTIAENAFYVASNWTGASVGKGVLYRGHSDNNGGALAASVNDQEGYFNTGNNALQADNSGKEQRRTLTLSNGETIWDIAGNVWEFILFTDSNNTYSGNQPSNNINETSFLEKEWKDVSEIGNYAPYPQDIKNIVNSLTGQQNGIGKLFSNYSVLTDKAMLIGGSKYNGGLTGVFSLRLQDSNLSTNSYFGFRVVKKLTP